MLIQIDSISYVRAPIVPRISHAERLHMDRGPAGWHFRCRSSSHPGNRWGQDPLASQLLGEPRHPLREE